MIRSQYGRLILVENCSADRPTKETTHLKRWVRRSLLISCRSAYERDRFPYL
jgi:hypothetical protein